VLNDDGSAVAGENPAEGSIMWDTFARSTDKYRGRYDEKLTVENHYLGADTRHVGGVIFNDLKDKLGEGCKILKATLTLSCCNASVKDKQSAEVIAYPFIEEWNYPGFSWVCRKYNEAGKTEKNLPWNQAAPEINLTPAPDSTADANVYDFTGTHKGKPIRSQGMRPAINKPDLRQGDTAEFDVTEVVKLWCSGDLPNYGWALVAPNAGTYIRFWASNGDQSDPRLTIEYEGGAPPQAAPVDLESLFNVSPTNPPPAAE
jgi:hypothetical protein